jgi:hypothetical protein
MLPAWRISTSKTSRTERLNAPPGLTISTQGRTKCPKAAYDHTTSAPPAVMPPCPATKATGHPDAEIIRLSEQFVANDEERDRLEFPYRNVVRVPAYTQARLDELSAYWTTAAEQLGAMQAVTLEGVLAKAVVLQRFYAPGYGLLEDPQLEKGSEDQLPWSLCRDLLAMAGMGA